MGVKVYISGMSGNKEVKKRQQRVLMILDSRNIEYSVVDITDPGREPDKDYMQEKSTSLGATVSDKNPRHPLPPQLFNDEEYCGDYDQFDLANEIDELDKFLKLASSDSTLVSNAEISLGNGTAEVGAGQEPEVESSELDADSSEIVADMEVGNKQKLEDDVEVASSEAEPEVASSEADPEVDSTDILSGSVDSTEDAGGDDK